MKAYFAGGCFWCVTPVYKMYGVDAVTCGYSGGDEPCPRYGDVKAQRTGHRETIMLEYAPEKVSFEKLLGIYFANIDPFDGEGQFIDRGFSYSPAIYYADDAQKAAAEARVKLLEDKSGRKVRVSLEPFKSFWPAEEYHQDYYLKHPEEFERELIGSGRVKPVVRRAAKADEELVTRLSLKLWPEHDAKEMAAETRAQLCDEDTALFLCFVRERAAGFAACSLRHDYVEGTQSSPVGYLEGVYTDESFRKLGVAKALLAACEGWARQRGCSEFASDCELTNEPSRLFHLKAGFTEANRVICFVKQL